jgi:hypothetical protein
MAIVLFIAALQLQFRTRDVNAKLFLVIGAGNCTDHFEAA